MINFERARAESALLEKAFRHRSYSADHNETLEFLGDAVIDLAVGDLLMEKHPELEEGELTRWRASLVNEQSLYEQAMKLGFETQLKVGEVEKKQMEAFKRRALASCFEAVIGVFFKEKGYNFTRQWIESCFGSMLIELPQADFHFSDHKTRFQEWAQEKLKITPTYRLLETEGSDHRPHFIVEVLLGEKVVADGNGASKKQAEQKAAQKALDGQQGILTEFDLDKNKNGKKEVNL